MHTETVYDHVVVGGGSAGCAAAGRLVEKHGARVLMLEAGVEDRNPLIRMPAGSFKLLFSDAREVHHHLSPPQPTLGGRQVDIAQANVLGGGSSINAMAYVRGAPGDYDEWADHAGHEGDWGWQAMLPYFREQEGNIRFDDAYHGMNGPYKVSDPLWIDKGSHIFVQTLRDMGIPPTPDFNGQSRAGVGYVQQSTYRGRRWSAADAFVRNIANARKLTIRTGATVTRLLFDGRRATGVEYIERGQVKRVTVRGEVLLAAGAFVSPKILMLSGIGAADELRAHGIDVRLDSPGVGKNLADHIMAPVASTSTNPGYFGADKGLRMLRAGVQWALSRTGPATTNGAEAQALIRVGDAVEPNFQIYHLNILWAGADVDTPSPGVTLLANLLKPYSRGDVRLRSGDFRDDPIVNPNWLSDQRDIDRLVQAMRFLREIKSAQPYSDIVVEEVMPGPAVETDAQWQAYLRAVVETNYHPCGTCKMGADSDPMAVLTPDLKVRGVDGLRVIDASMMPTIPAANLNPTVTAVAAKAVDMMMA